MKSTFLLRSRKSRAILALCVLSIFVVFISSVRAYRGDGGLKNYGWFHLKHKFEVTFNAFSMDKSKLEKVYNFSNLPSSNYSFGLKVIPDGNELINYGEPTFSTFIKRYNILRENHLKIGLILLEDSKRKIHIEESPVEDWVVSDWEFWHGSKQADLG